MFLNQTTVMGIVNLTPDSFYDGGKFNDKQSLLNHIKKINGSDIIDVGCESSFASTGFAVDTVAVFASSTPRSTSGTPVS